jgi:hypothetical protein
MLLCFRGMTVYTSPVTRDNPGQEGSFIGGDLMKLLADIDMQLLLISRLNPLSSPITNSDLIRKALNGLMSILTCEVLKFDYSVRHS